MDANVSDPVRIDFPEPRSIVQFLDLGTCGDQAAIQLYAITPRGKALSSIYLGEIELPGGDDPRIASTFLANADGDEDQELFVIVRSEIRHPGLRTEGSLYSVYAFDIVATSPMRIVHMESVEKSLGVGLDGILEGKRVSYPYKDAMSVRKFLRKQGH